MAEILKYRREVAAVALGVTAALGITACGSAQTPAKSAEATAGSASSPISQKVNYLSNGMRVIVYKGQLYDDPEANPRYEKLDIPSDLLEFCDGGDLVTQTLGYNGGLSTSVDRSSSPTSLAKCADGKLTASDFTPQPTAPNLAQ
jgi:hypothetical protein